jgi:molecular chaperone DnaK (HSP70)
VTQPPETLSSKALSPQTPEGAADHLVVGIDVGTTNSLAALLTDHGPKVIRDRDGSPLIPSMVTILEDGQQLVGSAARAVMLDHPDRTIYSVKRLIGRAGEEVATEAKRLPYPVRQGERGLARIRIDGRDWSPEEISAIVLTKVKQVCDAALETTVKDAVITVPAYFDDGQRQATKDAAAIAGLNCLRIINEPTAASLAYGIDGSKDGTVLVYDLGGGTFDVSILKIQDGVFRVLSTAGNTHLGGDDFDGLLATKIKGILAEHTRDADLLSPYVMQAVRKSAEGLKVQLSEHDQASLSIDLGAAGAADLTVTRAEFEALIAPLIDETLQCCQRAMTDAGLTYDEIDDVVLVGGSTRIPLVRRKLEALAGRPPHTEVDPDLAVAMGAAIQANVLAGVLAGGTRSMLLLDVVPLSLGIETMGAVVDKLILRNTTIPTSVTQEYSTQVENQTAVDINIYQGEREKVEDCRQLGSFKLRGIPPMPAGLPRIAVTFLVDADGVLKVLAREQRTGAEASVQVLPSFGLTREEVGKMMADSIEHAQEDMAERETIELHNKARAMVEGTGKALALADLPPDQTYTIKQCVKKLAKLLEDDAGYPELQATTEELSRLTGQVADDVISSAVTKALGGQEATTKEVSR